MSRGFESHTLRNITPGQTLVIGINHRVCHASLPQLRGCALWHRVNRARRNGPNGRKVARMSRDTKTAYRARAAATERMVDAAVAEVAAERTAEFEAARAATAARRATVPFTEEQYQAATAIRTKLGWRPVVKVSAKSVSVATGYSWNDRVPRAQILEVRS